MALKTEVNTPAMESRIRAAFLASTTGTGIAEGFAAADFEHGQWWITNLDTGAQWSVVDAVGGSSVDGFDFEQVTRGEDD